MVLVEFGHGFMMRLLVLVNVFSVMCTCIVRLLVMWDLVVSRNGMVLNRGLMVRSASISLVCLLRWVWHRLMELLFMLRLGPSRCLLSLSRLGRFLNLLFLILCLSEN